MTDAVDVDGPARPRTALYVALGIGVVLVVLVAVLATRESASARLAKSPLVGRAAPALAGAVVTGGAPFDLDEHAGRFVLVNFFATWCTPCQAEHDDLVRFAETHGGDADVVSVVYSDDEDDVAAFFAERGGDWPVVGDGDGAIATAWGVAQVPESYLVAPDGQVLGKIIGGATFDFLDAQLARFQGGS